MHWIQIFYLVGLIAVIACWIAFVLHQWIVGKEDRERIQRSIDEHEKKLVTMEVKAAERIMEGDLVYCKDGKAFTTGNFRGLYNIPYGTVSVGRAIKAFGKLGNALNRLRLKEDPLKRKPPKHVSSLLNMSKACQKKRMQNIRSLNSNRSYIVK